jgi:hypothetical protein
VYGPESTSEDDETKYYSKNRINSEAGLETVRLQFMLQDII